MCGIAGIIDLVGQRPAPEGVVQRMARAITHRGPDEEGFLEQPGISLASRRLSIVDLADGQQPMTNEDRSVFVVFNGELFDYVERREELVRQGHRFRTHCDTNLPLPCGTSGSDNSISDAIALVSRHFSGAGRATGCSLLPRSKACLRQEWFHHDPTVRGSITCLPSPRCRARGHVLKAFNSCRPGTLCVFSREVRAQVRSLWNAPTGRWISRSKVKKSGERIRVRW